jgi:hypothetical protein
MDLQTFGKYLALVGLSLALVGGLLVIGGRLGFGSLPGNLRIQREGFSCYVPIAASIILSLLLTLILNLLLRWFR